MIKLAYLIPLFPLIGFLINGLGRKWISKSISGIVASALVLISFILSVMIFNDVSKPGFQPVPQKFFDFIHTSTLNIPFAFQIDQLSSLFLLIITGVGFLIHVYSTSYMHEESKEHYARYFAYLNLFVFSMLMLVMGGNFVIMFIGWEGVGLCSYLLIGYWFKNHDYNNAAKKAFVMNRIGDLGFLLALFWMISTFGTTDFPGIFSKANGVAPKVLMGITLLMFIGATGKSAQIPLYTWLPDAMAGPTPVSALIHAATMVTAGIYMIARSNILFTLAPVTPVIITIIGLATALLAASIALKQNDIKKVLAYSTVSQLGIMFLGLGVGAYTGAVFHVMTHAFFKALLFLCAGSVIHAMHHEQDIIKMGGLKKYLPVTHLSFLIGCIAIAGIPPFAGFFSKDEILMGAFAKSPLYFFGGLFTSLLTAFYMFRLYSLTFLGKFRGTEEQRHHLHESPWAMTMPLLILAIFSIGSGFLGIPELFAKDAHWLQSFLSPIFAESVNLQSEHHIPHNTEWVLMISTVVMILVMTFMAILRFSRFAIKSEKSSWFGRLLQNKWYVDEIYDSIISKPLIRSGKFLNAIVERYVIDGAVNGVGRLVQYGGRQLRWLQSGQVGSYLLIMIIATIILFIIQLFGK